MTDTERFDAKVVRQANGCHLWIGSKDSSGYGHVKVHGTLHKSHRVAWERLHGAIPPGKVLLHSCDTPACVNTDHLTVGTQRENMADKQAKGRSNFAKGADNSQVVLCEADVYAIRSSSVPHRYLAEAFGVSPSTIQKIKARRIWEWLK